MSAFIIDDTTMHRALEGVAYANRSNGYDVDALTRLGRAWFAMNIEAVRQRYGKSHDFDEPQPDEYEFKFIERHPADYYKALCCLQYQCAEGEIPDTDEFKELSAIVGRCAHRLVTTHIPQYEAAPWDAEGVTRYNPPQDPGGLTPPML